MTNPNQMLRQSESLKSMLAGNNTALCAKKDLVVEKLNGLADQILEEIKTLNATDAAKLKAKDDAHQASCHC